LRWVFPSTFFSNTNLASRNPRRPTERPTGQSNKSLLFQSSKFRSIPSVHMGNMSSHVPLEDDLETRQRRSATQPRRRQSRRTVRFDVQSNHKREHQKSKPWQQSQDPTQPDPAHPDLAYPDDDRTIQDDPFGAPPPDPDGVWGRERVRPPRDTGPAPRPALPNPTRRTTPPTQEQYSHAACFLCGHWPCDCRVERADGQDPYSGPWAPQGQSTSPYAGPWNHLSRYGNNQPSEVADWATTSGPRYARRTGNVSGAQNIVIVSQRARTPSAVYSYGQHNWVGSSGSTSQSEARDRTQSYAPRTYRNARGSSPE
jgi:hypothetical protein